MAIVMTACSTPAKKGGEAGTAFIGETVVKTTVDRVVAEQPAADLQLLEKGVRHAASLWREEDGTAEEFAGFVSANCQTQGSVHQDQQLHGITGGEYERDHTRPEKDS